MACCAFAIYLIAQLYGALAIFKRFRAPDMPMDGAATWRAGAANGSAVRLRYRRRRWLFTGVALALIVAGALALMPRGVSLSRLSPVFCSAARR